MKAYPFTHRHPTTGVTTSSEGMDLRDYFAGLAMQGLLSSPSSADDDLVLYEHYANGAYKMADAMLKAREPKDEQS